MRAREFVEQQDKTVSVTIPINITIPSGDKEVTVTQPAATDIDNIPQTDHQPETDIANTPDDEKVTMVPPLQQELEVDKASVGKQSQVIDTILDDPDSEEESLQPLSYR